MTENSNRTVPTTVSVELSPDFALECAVPLNSRKLTISIVKAIAQALSLPGTGSKEETLLMIEGKLAEDGCEPQNVQIMITGREGTTDVLDMELIGEDGPFLSIVLQRVTTRNAPQGVLDEEPGDFEGEGGHERDNPSSELQVVREENDLLKQRLSEMQAQLDKVTERMKSLWRANCSLAREFEGAISDKDAEIEHLKQQLVDTQGEALSIPDPTVVSNPSVVGVPQSVTLLREQKSTNNRRGKAPPVDPFNGEDEAIRLDDWLPALQRASTWNSWSDGDLLLQLAGHLRGRALQEWELISEDLKCNFSSAVSTLRERLDPGGRMLAVQDFRHAAQKNEESVADFIRRLERCFRVAYGRDNLGKEAREALLHGQLQEGLKMELMRSPSVSGAQSYPALCLAAKNEERRLTELRKRQHYKNTTAMPPVTNAQAAGRKSGTRLPTISDGSEKKFTPPSSSLTPRKCYTCGSTKHLQRDCRVSRQRTKARARSQVKPAR
jgi:hypothetical protein